MTSRKKGRGGPPPVTVLDWVQPPEVKQADGKNLLSAVVRITKGNYTQAGVNVVFTIKGVTYGNDTTGVTGEARLSNAELDLESGDYTLAAEIAGQNFRKQGPFKVKATPEEMEAKKKPVLRISLGEQIQTKDNFEVPVTAMVSHQGKPLPGVKVKISSSTASPIELVTNSEGKIQTVIISPLQSQVLQVTAEATVTMAEESYLIYDSTTKKLEYAKKRPGNATFSDAVETKPGEYVVKVLVEDEDKLPLPGVMVSVTGGKKPLEKKTDENGMAKLDLICHQKDDFTEFAIDIPTIEKIKKYKLPGKIKKNLIPQEKRLDASAPFKEHLDQGFRVGKGEVGIKKNTKKRPSSNTNFKQKLGYGIGKSGGFLICNNNGRWLVLLIIFLSCFCWGGYQFSRVVAYHMQNPVIQENPNNGRSEMEKSIYKFWDGNLQTQEKTLVAKEAKSEPKPSLRSFWWFLRLMIIVIFFGIATLVYFPISRLDELHTFLRRILWKFDRTSGGMIKDEKEGVLKKWLESKFTPKTAVETAAVGIAVVTATAAPGTTVSGPTVPLPSPVVAPPLAVKGSGLWQKIMLIAIAAEEVLEYLHKFIRRKP